MTIRIQNLTCWIYGCFIGIVHLTPDIIDALMNLREEWLMVIFYFFLYRSLSRILGL